MNDINSLSHSKYRRQETYGKIKIIRGRGPKTEICLTGNLGRYLCYPGHKRKQTNLKVMMF